MFVRKNQPPSTSCSGSLIAPVLRSDGLEKSATRRVMADGWAKDYRWRILPWRMYRGIVRAARPGPQRHFRKRTAHNTRPTFDRQGLLDSLRFILRRHHKQGGVTEIRIIENRVGKNVWSGYFNAPFIRRLFSS